MFNSFIFLTIILLFIVKWGNNVNGCYPNPLNACCSPSLSTCTNPCLQTFNPPKPYHGSYGEYEASHERIIETPYVSNNLYNKGNNGNYGSYNNNGYETNYNNRLTNSENYESKQSLPYVAPSISLPLPNYGSSLNQYGSNYLTPNQNNYGLQYPPSVGIPYSNALKPYTVASMDNLEYSLPSGSNSDNIYSQIGYTNKGEASVFPLSQYSGSSIPYSARNHKATQKAALTSKLTATVNNLNKKKITKNLKKN